MLPNDGPTHIPPLQFIGVDGKEEQSEDSPSYYNYLEAIAIVEQVVAIPVLYAGWSHSLSSRDKFRRYLRAISIYRSVHLAGRRHDTLTEGLSTVAYLCGPLRSYHGTTVSQTQSNVHSLVPTRDH